ncbi:MAG: HEPN domain-containing protein [Deltaproteobacteria bacterium]|nr:HEPN domain-containing protein [Deltaproteobacteria bacterium]MBW1793083.1 HEPN domain-containing protein [Deltaproteobacteria bacterium]MBW2330232.1 HEPN domain-containing protein [Deltaproteobacteria bacterium]
MIDIDKQISFWRNSAEEDLAVARDLVDRNRIRHGLFFAHLALEKALKAHVCCVTQDIAPRLHNLVRLAELAELDIQPAQMDILAEMNSFNIEGRYPDTLSPPPSQEEAQHYMTQGEEVFQWLISMF